MAAEVKLKYALAYKGREQKLYRDATDLVMAASSVGTGLFPINQLPNIRKPEIQKFILTQSESVFDAAIEFSEAVGLVAVAIEGKGLCEMHYDEKKRPNLREILKLEDEMLPSVVIRGFIMFAERFERVSGVRKVLRDNLQLDTTKINYEEVKQNIEVYGEGLRQDKFIISENATQAMVRDVVKLSEKEDAAERRFGANKARNLYLEVLGLATEEFPTTS